MDKNKKIVKGPGGKDEVNNLAVLAKNGNKGASQQLVMEMLPYIKKTVATYNVKADDFEDFVNDCVCALYDALNTYDETKGAFSTHFYYWIKASVLKGFRKSENLSYNSDDYNKKNRYEKMVCENDESDFSEDLFEEYRLTEKEVKDIERNKKQFISLDSEIPGSEDNSKLSVSEVIAGTDNTEETACDNALMQTLRKDMERVLNEEERFVITTYYGLDDGIKKSMEETACLMQQKLGRKRVTRQRIKQVKDSAEEKLREAEL